MSRWFFNAYMDGVIKEVKMGMGRSEISRGGKIVEIA